VGRDTTPAGGEFAASVQQLLRASAAMCVSSVVIANLRTHHLLPQDLPWTLVREQLVSEAS